MRYSLGGLQVWRTAQRVTRSVAVLERAGAVLVGVFLVLAATYSVVTPLFEAPDEVWHFRFITHVADTGTLPIQDPDNPGPWRQEGSQPPLYYLLVAPFIASVDAGDVELITRRNPHAAVGQAGADGNVNFVVHTLQERFPWRGATLAAHLARLVSVLLGAATVTLTYLLALEVFGMGRPSNSLLQSPDAGAERAHMLALGAALMVALNPQFLFISGAINNDNLVITLATLTLFLLLRLVNRGVSRRRLVGLGIVLGLAALSKLSGLGLLGLAGLVLLALAWQRRDPAALVRWGVIVLGVAGLMAGWWYVRNWMLYGDPTGLNVMLRIFGRRSEPASPLQLVREFQGLRWSFWAVFGWFNLLPPGWMLHFFDLLSVLGAIGFVVFIVRLVQARNWAVLGRLGILVVWLGITLVSLGRWTTMTSGTQGRLLFPAISVVGILLFTGLAALAPSRPPLLSRLPAVLGAVMGFVAVYAIFGVIRPAYAPPPALSAAQVDAIPHVLSDVVFGERIALVGYQVAPEVIRPGDDLTVTLYWRGLRPVEKDYSLFIHLIGENNVILAQRDSYPGRGNAPTSEWHPGVVFEDSYLLHVPATASAPQSAWIAVGLYNLATRGRLRLPDGSEWFPLKAMRLVPTGGEAAIPNPLGIELGGQVKLAGYELSARTLHPGETTDLVLYWQALADMDRDYTVFTQILSDDKVIWAQDDTQPLQGGYPTSRWAPGEVVRDVYHLTVKPETPAGIYHLELGMYLLETGERLYRTDEPAENSIRLAEIRVLPAN